MDELTEELLVIQKKSFELTEELFAIQKKSLELEPTKQRRFESLLSSINDILNKDEQKCRVSSLKLHRFNKSKLEDNQLKKMAYVCHVTSKLDFINSQKYKSKRNDIMNFLAKGYSLAVNNPKIKKMDQAASEEMGRSTNFYTFVKSLNFRIRLVKPSS